MLFPPNMAYITALAKVCDSFCVKKAQTMADKSKSIQQWHGAVNKFNNCVSDRKIVWKVSLRRHFYY